MRQKINSCKMKDFKLGGAKPPKALPVQGL